MTLTEFDYMTVIDEKGCRIWQGSRNPDGYGCAYHEKKTQGAHRVSWKLNRGPIPAGLWVLHKCDNPPCVNPNHLWLGDRRENMLDCIKKKRHNHVKKTHCIRGHDFKVFGKVRFNRRYCMECDRQRWYNGKRNSTTNPKHVKE